MVDQQRGELDARRFEFRLRRFWIPGKPGIRVTGKPDWDWRKSEATSLRFQFIASVLFWAVPGDAATGNLVTSSGKAVQTDGVRSSIELAAQVFVNRGTGMGGLHVPTMADLLKNISCAIV